MNAFTVALDLFGKQSHCDPDKQRDSASKLARIGRLTLRGLRHLFKSLTKTAGTRCVRIRPRLCENAWST
jgi:hypothetical protein